MQISYLLISSISIFCSIIRPEKKYHNFDLPVAAVLIVDVVAGVVVELLVVAVLLVVVVLLVVAGSSSVVNYSSTKVEKKTMRECNSFLSILQNSRSAKTGERTKQEQLTVLPQ